MTDKTSLIDDILAQESQIAERVHSEKQHLRAHLDTEQEKLERRVQNLLLRMKKRLVSELHKEETRLRSLCDSIEQDHLHTMEVQRSIPVERLEDLLDVRLMQALRGDPHDRQDVEN